MWPWLEDDQHRGVAIEAKRQDPTLEVAIATNATRTIKGAPDVEIGDARSRGKDEEKEGGRDGYGGRSGEEWE